MRARENSFALTSCRLWNSLPKSIRDIRGEDLPHFNGKLDRVLSHYPDVPRCGTSGHSMMNMVAGQIRDVTIIGTMKSEKLWEK